MTAVFDYYYDEAYKVSSNWNTAVDKTFSGKEQRRSLWSNSQKKWTLDFDKNKVDTAAIMAFFDARKGSFEAFFWTWRATDPVTNEEMGGDGATYLVRFESDSLSFEHNFAGFTKFSINLVEVFN